LTSDHLIRRNRRRSHSDRDMALVTWETFHNAADADLPDADAVDDEPALIAAAIEDATAFAPLYQRYAPRVYGYCLRRLVDRERAADATSQIFIRALGALPRFDPDPARPGATFRAWLFTIAHNPVMDAHRRHRPHASLDIPAVGGGSAATKLRDPARSPEDLAIAGDDAERVRAMLAVLPERQRRILELRLADLTGAEIAEALRMSLYAVKSAQFRAYQTLRDRFPHLHPGRSS
jgi:RNA polymerase sigma-70 factor (ECF subfamily)